MNDNETNQTKPGEGSEVRETRLFFGLPREADPEELKRVIRSLACNLIDGGIDLNDPQLYNMVFDYMLSHYDPDKSGPIVILCATLIARAHKVRSVNCDPSADRVKRPLN
ncbi:MAG TPA: hypothetical protein VEB86_18465 [Chryseosolibacter sp.]|nr:hypothetical protein [Chryseosolibacter sp.]